MAIIGLVFVDVEADSAISEPRNMREAAPTIPSLLTPVMKAAAAITAGKLPETRRIPTPTAQIPNTAKGSMKD